MIRKSLKSTLNRANSTQTARALTYGSNHALGVRHVRARNVCYHNIFGNPLGHLPIALRDL
jgi:hypothetical protein